MSSFRFWHNTYKIDPNHIWVDFMFMNIHKQSPLKNSSFCYSKRIKRMSIILIFSITHFYKDKEITILCDNIYFSSLNLVISFDDSPSFLFEVFCCYIFSFISDASPREYHINRKIIRLFSFLKIPVLVDQDHCDQEHNQ